MKKIPISKEYLINEYLNKNRTISDISKDLGCHRCTVERTLSKYNIPKNMRIRNEKPESPTKEQRDEILNQINKTEDKGQKLKLYRKLGLSYRQISKVTKTPYSSVVYYCDDNFRRKRCNEFRSLHPYKVKLNTFLYQKHNLKSKKTKFSTNCTKLLSAKIRNFHPKGVNKMNFTYQDVLNKFGEHPKCYLTGEEIDIYKPRTYNFDHIIPSSRGGQSTLDNLGICTKQANQAKSDMTPDEFIYFCKKILEYNGFNVATNSNP